PTAGRGRRGRPLRRTRGHRRAAEIRPDAPPAVARSARPEARNRARSSPSDADASFAPMDELHSVLREGLREEAAPISRRLAEVKGLSNNAVRRLDRIESTLDAERLARIDDLALLVELLTEGWRSLNVRLARIEAALDAAPARVVPLRETG